MASGDSAAVYRLYAVDCVDMAQMTQDTERRAKLLTMAQAWLVLADQAEKNSTAPTLVYETPGPRQQVAQQQQQPHAKKG
jgi:hypothetical protein